MNILVLLDNAVHQNGASKRPRPDENEKDEEEAEEQRKNGDSIATPMETAQDGHENSHVTSGGESHGGELGLQQQQAAAAANAFAGRKEEKSKPISSNPVVGTPW